jgi:hypothetical protein
MIEVGLQSVPDVLDGLVRQHLQDGFDVVVEVGVERGRRRN